MVPSSRGLASQPVPHSVMGEVPGGIDSGLSIDFAALNEVVGALYADGTLDAPFDSNETHRVADLALVRALEHRGLRVHAEDLGGPRPKADISVVFNLGASDRPTDVARCRSASTTSSTSPSIPRTSR